MTNVSHGFLIDTNVLVYPYDPRDVAKQQQALLVVRTLVTQNRAILSTQCLTELFNVVANRLPQRMSVSEARARVEALSESCRVIEVTLMVVLEGCRGVAEYGFSIWDALIWAAARLNQIPVVLTEDQEHGRVIDAVRFWNPFDPRFDLAWLQR